MGASPDDETERVRLGASHATSADQFRRLATDSSVRVRATLAMNAAVPPDADRSLARDPDERVRLLLARKLATLTTHLPPETRSHLPLQAFETLTRLVADEAERVRAVVADAVKDMPDAPKALILRLAHDASIMVAEPVILFSPLLTTSDLLSLIAAAPSTDTVVAIARRPALEESVTDAIAASTNFSAINALLANPSARIREAVLDALVAASVEHPDWQASLVRRPTLPARAARALSDIVQAHLLAVLSARSDLDPAAAARIAERLTATHAAEARALSRHAALAEANRLARADLLTEQVLLSAIRQGEVRLTTALVAVAADIPREVVEHMAVLRSAKALTSFVWQAGFSMRAASAVQTLLGGLSPAEAIPASRSGGFPFSTEEMRWQVEFACQSARNHMPA